MSEHEHLLEAQALVDLILGTDAGLKALEAAVEANDRDKALLVGAARAHALAARLHEAQRAAAVVGLASPSGLTGLLALTSPGGAKHRLPAAALLERAIEAGQRNPGEWALDPDLAPVTEVPALRDRLVRRGTRRAYATVGREAPDREATGLHGLSPVAHLARCRDLAAQGWRPAALSLTAVPGEAGPVAASLWQRPVAAAERLRAARRQSAAGAALLRLADEESVWPMFRHSEAPTARSNLIARLATHRVDPQALIRRLSREKDDSARRALIVALGDYREADLPAAARAPLVKQLLAWYRDDPDPGVHGAIDWLLRPGREGPIARPLDWGQSRALEEVDGELARRDPDGRRGWYVNRQGETFSVIRGPVTFRRGSPPWEAERHPSNETPHLRVIPRSYALAAKAVTVAQWEKFLKDRPLVRHSYEKHYSPEPGGPIIRVGLWEAMQYCNWLSEKEKLPRDQWCYPEVIEDGMRPFPDYLRRTGYRLPSESEWEYACRAGAGTTWYFGDNEDLLPRYAWFGMTRGERAWPVGTKRPNDLGLFDMHGNVTTWCQEPAEFYEEKQRSEDRPDLGRVFARRARLLRGGGYFSPPKWARSATRIIEGPDSRFPSYGIRVCRTVPPRR